MDRGQSQWIFTSVSDLIQYKKVWRYGNIHDKRECPLEREIERIEELRRKERF